MQHLSDIKFSPNEYSEYPDNEEKEIGSLQQINEQQIKNNLYIQTNSHHDAEESLPADTLDKSM